MILTPTSDNQTFFVEHVSESLFEKSGSQIPYRNTQACSMYNKYTTGEVDYHCTEYEVQIVLQKLSSSFLSSVANRLFCR